MKRQKRSNASTAGFTLLEVLVIVIMIGVLFAIAAPGWVAFINQQRVGSARNQLSQAIRSAQDQAKRTQVYRAVVFDNNAGQPRYAVVPVQRNDSSRCTVPTNITNWESLGNGEIQRNTIRLTTKLGNGPVQDAARNALIFDTYGNVATLPCENTALPYTITVHATSSVNPRRCIKVTTLLGATEETSDSECQ